MTITRRNYGRGHGYTIDGQKVPGVTSILGVLGKPALINWAAETTAGYAVDHWEDLADQPPSKRLAQLMKARYQDLDQAANRGTEVHNLAERHMRGEEIEIPDELDGHVAAYEQFVEDWQPQAIGIELVIANRSIGYCGTTDLVARLGDGQVWLTDWKTSRSGIFPETAMQLAAYLHAEVYLDQDGAEQPMANLGVQRVGAIHLRADGYSFYPIDQQALNDAWLFFRHAAWMHRQMDDGKNGKQLPQDWIGTSLPAPRRVSA